jgi:hypothetical protein
MHHIEFNVEECIQNHVQAYRDNERIRLEMDVQHCLQQCRNFETSETHNRIDEIDDLQDDLIEAREMLYNDLNMSNDVYLDNLVGEILDAWGEGTKRFFHFFRLARNIVWLMEIIPTSECPLTLNVETLSLWLYENSDELYAPYDRNVLFQHLQYICNALQGDALRLYTSRGYTQYKVNSPPKRIWSKYTWDVWHEELPQSSVEKELHRMMDEGLGQFNDI